MKYFRQDIIYAQRTRADLLKWKLIISAALGAVGLGIYRPEAKATDSLFPFELAFCLIPFVCAYVDLLCYHLNLRIFVINKFFKRFKVECPNQKSQNTNWENNIFFFQQYEATCDQVRSTFELESWALKWTSILLLVSIIILIYFAPNKTEAYLFLIAGILGVLMAIITETVYDNKIADLKYIQLEEIRLTNTDNHNGTIKPQKPNKLVQLEWIKRFSLPLLTIFLVVGIRLIYNCIENMINYKTDESSPNISTETFLIILAGILYIIAATLIENFYRKIIDLQIEKIQFDSSNHLYKLIKECKFYLLFILIIIYQITYFLLTNTLNLIFWSIELQNIEFQLLCIGFLLLIIGLLLILWAFMIVSNKITTSTRTKTERPINRRDNPNKGIETPNNPRQEHDNSTQ